VSLFSGVVGVGIGIGIGIAVGITKMNIGFRWADDCILFIDLVYILLIGMWL
jgi:hypothetical protein